MNHDLGLLIFQIGSVWNSLSSYKWIAFSICDDSVSASLKLRHGGVLGTHACLSAPMGWALPLPLHQEASLWIRQFTRKGLSDTLANCFSYFCFNPMSFLAQFTFGHVAHSSKVWGDQVCPKVPWSGDAFCYQSYRHFLIDVNLVSLILLFFFSSYRKHSNRQEPCEFPKGISNHFPCISVAEKLLDKSFYSLLRNFCSMNDSLNISGSMCCILTMQQCGLNDQVLPLLHICASFSYPFGHAPESALGRIFPNFCIQPAKSCELLCAAAGTVQE